MAAKSTLANRRILIIGGSSGIGLATAYAASQQGARVAIAGRDAARLKVAAEQIGENVETYRVDISKEGRAKQLFSKVGKLDHLILTAASGVFKPFLDTDRADFAGAWVGPAVFPALVHESLLGAVVRVRLAVVHPHLDADSRGQVHMPIR